MEKTEKPPVDAGLKENDCRRIAESLSRVLADTYTLYLKTQNAHWNAMGPQFFGLHKALDEQYHELADATDEIAERIRALGYPVNATFADFQRLTSVKEGGPAANAADAVHGLIDGQQATILSLRATGKMAEASGDQGTLDLLGKRLAAHEKMAWMLRSLKL